MDADHVLAGTFAWQTNYPENLLTDPAPSQPAFQIGVVLIPRMERVRSDSDPLKSGIVQANSLLIHLRSNAAILGRWEGRSLANGTSRRRGSRPASRLDERLDRTGPSRTSVQQLLR